MDLLKVAEQSFVNENVSKFPEFKAGDTITVACKIKEGDKVEVALEGKVYNCIFKELQENIMTGTLVHADFQIV